MAKRIEFQFVVGKHRQLYDALIRKLISNHPAEEADMGERLESTVLSDEELADCQAVSGHEGRIKTVCKVFFRAFRHYRMCMYWLDDFLRFEPTERMRHREQHYQDLKAANEHLKKDLQNAKNQAKSALGTINRLTASLEEKDDLLRQLQAELKGRGVQVSRCVSQAFPDGLSTSSCSVAFGCDDVRTITPRNVSRRTPMNYE